MKLPFFKNKDKPEDKRIAKIKQETKLELEKQQKRELDRESESAYGTFVLLLLSIGVGVFFYLYGLVKQGEWQGLPQVSLDSLTPQSSDSGVIIIEKKD